jgi:hypothetical protein
LLTTETKYEATIKAHPYNCDGDKIICNGEKIFGMCDGKKKSDEKVVMKCKCNLKRGTCKLKIKPNVKNLENRDCFRNVPTTTSTTTTTLPTTTTTVSPSEIGACYLDPLFFTKELDCDKPTGLNDVGKDTNT